MSVKDPVPTMAEKLATSFRADPKKGTFLSVLVIVMVVLWARMLTGAKTPGAARAAEFVSASKTDNAMPATFPRATSAGTASLLDWARKPIVPISRNLFAVPLDYYPGNGARASEGETTGAGFWDEIAKSLSAKADQQEQRRILVENVRALAGSLKLQSTMMGSQPGAMVNGEMVHEGSVINGFCVTKIEARRMIVQYEGVRLEIVMK